MMNSQKHIEDASLQLQEAITDKLRAILGEEGVEILTEYVWHMLISSKRCRNYISQELQEFLADETGSFVEWLLSHVVPQVDEYVLQVDHQHFYNDSDSQLLEKPGHRETSTNQYQDSSLNYVNVNSQTTDSLEQPSNKSQQDERLSGKNTIPKRLRQERRTRLLQLAVQQVAKEEFKKDLCTDIPNMNHRNSSVDNNMISSMSLNNEFNIDENRMMSVDSISGLGYRENNTRSLRRLPVNRRKLFDNSNRYVNSRTTRNRSSNTQPLLQNIVPLKRDLSCIDDENNMVSNLPYHGSVSSNVLFPENHFELPGTQMNRVPPPPMHSFIHEKRDKKVNNPTMPVGNSYSDIHAKVPNVTIRELQELAASHGLSLAPAHNKLVNPVIVIPNKKIKKRCGKWPKCPFSDNCKYVHPSVMCENWPHCSYGKSCLCIHPEVACKFGMNCHAINCNYTHPPEWDPTQNMAKTSLYSTYYQNKTLNLVQKDKSNQELSQENVEKKQNDLNLSTIQEVHIQPTSQTGVDIDVDMNS